jgi:hypothetical protein
MLIMIITSTVAILCIRIIVRIFFVDLLLSHGNNHKLITDLIGVNHYSVSRLYKT